MPEMPVASQPRRSGRARGISAASWLSAALPEDRIGDGLDRTIGSLTSSHHGVRSEPSSLPCRAVASRALGHALGATRLVPRVWPHARLVPRVWSHALGPTRWVPTLVHWVSQI